MSALEKVKEAKQIASELFGDRGEGGDLIVLESLLSEAEAILEKAADQPTLFAVVYSNYEPAETDSIWTTEEKAEARCTELNDSMWQVVPMMVNG